MPNTALDEVHVAVAVLRNAAGEVLIARRPAHVHQGGLWEFPGGKVEPGEPVTHALARELREELGVAAMGFAPLIRIRHDYGDKRVLLDVWTVQHYAGEPHGREGQPVLWVPAEALPHHDFPAANRPIVAAVRLPPLYLITGEPAQDSPKFLARLERALAAGIRLAQLRAKNLDEAGYRALAREALAMCRAHGARLLLNAAPALVEELGADGVHLASHQLHEFTARPLPPRYWVAASCHTLDDLRHAARIGADFAVLSPVRATSSHPDTTPLGWDVFAQLVEQAGLPVYALGGVEPDDVGIARNHGAQGVAAIRALWEREA